MPRLQNSILSTYTICTPLCCVYCASVVVFVRRVAEFCATVVARFVFEKLWLLFSGFGCEGEGWINLENSGNVLVWWDSVLSTVLLVWFGLVGWWVRFYLQ